MGLVGEVKHAILERDEKTNKVWKEGKPEAISGAILIDSLTELRMIRNTTTFSTEFSGDDLFWAFFKPMVAHFQAGYSVVVSLWDDADRVPSQKSGEQKSRTLLNKSEPYPANCTFNRYGILGLSMMHDAKKVDRDRLCASRGVRKALCLWYLECLRERCHTLIPDGGRFVLDFDSEGPWVLTRTVCTQIKYLRHPFGEADMMVPFWCRILRGMNVYVKTIDSDIFLILLQYHRRTGGGEGRKIYYEWLRKKPLSRQPKSLAEGEAKAKSRPVKKQKITGEDEEDTRKGKKNTVKDGVMYALAFTAGYIDIGEMDIAIGNRLWPCMLAFILCGTDFHHKQTLIQGIGNDFIIDWALQPSNTFCSSKTWDLSPIVEGLTNVWPWVFASPVHMAAWYKKRGGHTDGSRYHPPVPPPIFEGKTEAAVVHDNDGAIVLLDEDEEGEHWEGEEMKKKKTAKALTTTEKRRQARQKLLDDESKRMAIIADSANNTVVGRLFVSLLKDIGRYCERRKNSQKALNINYSTAGVATCCWNIHYWTADFRLITAVLPEINEGVLQPATSSPLSSIH